METLVDKTVNNVTVSLNTSARVTLQIPLEVVIKDAEGTCDHRSDDDNRDF